MLEILPCFSYKTKKNRQKSTRQQIDEAGADNLGTRVEMDVAREATASTTLAALEPGDPSNFAGVQAIFIREHLL